MEPHKAGMGVIWLVQRGRCRPFFHGGSMPDVYPVKPVLPPFVVEAMDRLRSLYTPDDHIEIGGWLVFRLWEDDDEFEVVATLIVARSR